MCRDRQIVREASTSQRCCPSPIRIVLKSRGQKGERRRRMKYRSQNVVVWPRTGQLASPWPDGGQSHVLQRSRVKRFRGGLASWPSNSGKEKNVPCPIGLVDRGMLLGDVESQRSSAAELEFGASLRPRGRFRMQTDKDAGAILSDEVKERKIKNRRNGDRHRPDGIGRASPLFEQENR